MCAGGFIWLSSSNMKVDTIHIDLNLVYYIIKSCLSRIVSISFYPTDRHCELHAPDKCFPLYRAQLPVTQSWDFVFLLFHVTLLSLLCHPHQLFDHFHGVVDFYKLISKIIF